MFSPSEALTTCRWRCRYVLVSAMPMARVERDYDFEGTAEEVPPQQNGEPRLPRSDRG